LLDIVSTSTFLRSPFSRRAVQELENMPGLRLLRNLFTMFDE